MRTRILVVDDDEISLNATRDVLESHQFSVTTATSGEAALVILREKLYAYGILLLDYRMPGMNGAELLAKIREFDTEAIALMYSCDDSRDSTRDSFRSGADDFLDKAGSVDKFICKIRSAEREYLDERKTLRDVLSTDETIVATLRDAGFVGMSKSLATSVVSAKRLAKQPGPFLIVGETGTGKELTAKLFSRDPNEPFITVNCAAFTDSQLVESALFGHEKGSFTGAFQKKIGIFEEAGSGIVFLDELHHLGKESQAKLLRALREKKIRPVGSSIERPVRCRVVAATQPSIDRMVSDGDFLLDLYHRIHCFKVGLAPLRERPEDIAPLTRHFLAGYNQRHKSEKVFMASAARALETYSWPGNVSELESIVISALANTDRNEITIHDLDEKVRKNRALPSAQSGVTLQSIEAEHQATVLSFIETTISQSKSLRHAANKLGIGESTMRSMRKSFKAAVKGIF